MIDSYRPRPYVPTSCWDYRAHNANEERISCEVKCREMCNKETPVTLLKWACGGFSQPVSTEELEQMIKNNPRSKYAHVRAREEIFMPEIACQALTSSIPKMSLEDAQKISDELDRLGFGKKDSSGDYNRYRLHELFILVQERMFFLASAKILASIAEKEQKVVGEVVENRKTDTDKK